MSVKIINISHRACDYECMWNGIEDAFVQKSGEQVPDHLFFCLSGIGNFVYMKSRQGDLKRFASWNDGRTQQMYQSVCDIIGFRYKYIEGRQFSYAMQKAKEQIDKGKPVVLGRLDMFYLPYYPKFYQQQHIPMHYVLMVGYDDEKQCVYVFDCGQEHMQQISYELLKNALDVEKTELGDKNTICVIDFEADLDSVIDIAKRGFERKARAMLNPPVSFIGIPGMRKLAREVLDWHSELTAEDYQNALRHMVMYTGTAPVLPNKLLGVPSDDNILHRAAREKLEKLLAQLGKEYRIEAWVTAAGLFQKSGLLIESITKTIVDYLLDEKTELNEIAKIILQIADIEEDAFQMILKGCGKESGSVK